MSTYRQPYKKPIKAGELDKCEYIEELRKVYFKPPKQTETDCDGYRNQYTKQPSNVCADCEWFAGNKGVKSDDGSGIDKGTS